ncbi:hypothetical protein IFM61392_00602 [Aspergillus lentulus]|nr:hypothetical protein IFM61392_00602 [Aspergillus lentulus]
MCGQSLSYTMEVPSLWEVPEIAEYLNEDRTAACREVIGLIKSLFWFDWYDDIAEAIDDPAFTIHDEVDSFPQGQISPMTLGLAAPYLESDIAVPVFSAGMPHTISLRSVHNCLLSRTNIKSGSNETIKPLHLAWRHRDTLTETNRYNVGGKRNRHDSIRVETTRRLIAEGERAAKDDQNW